MALSCMIVAEAGSGKSTSIESLDPQETFVINVSGKELPFKGWKGKYKKFDPKSKEGNYYETSDPKVVLRLLELINTDLKHIKTAVVDDYQFLSAFEYMNRAEEKGLIK